MAHHAYVLEAPPEEGIGAAGKFIARELGVSMQGNPDVVILRYGLLSAEEARGIAEVASAKAVGEKKVIIIAAARAYHEAQNALLKLFEEPPAETYLFLILPSLGTLLPTLKSRVHVLAAGEAPKQETHAFLKMSAEKRSALIKKLATGRDEEERRENRDEAIAIVAALESAAYEKFLKQQAGGASLLLRDISRLRTYLYDRAAPTRLILEHLSLMMDLV